MTDPRTPRNTTRAFREDPAEALLILADGMATGSPAGFIERQEADGQRQLVNSQVIPTDAPDAELEALGFTLGPAVEGDPMFRQATLPDGWKREGSDHAMWSYIVDGLGRRRCSVFYKAAFYDRSARIRVNTVAGYVSECLYDGTTPTLDDQWATKDAVLAAVAEHRQRSAKQVTLWTEHGNAEYADEYREKVRRCDDLKARIEASR
jgi:hypothetical protein